MFAFCFYKNLNCSKIDAFQNQSNKQENVLWGKNEL